MTARQKHRLDRLERKAALAEVERLPVRGDALAALLRSYAAAAERGEYITGAVVCIARDGTAFTGWSDPEGLTGQNLLLAGIGGLHHRLLCEAFGAGVEHVPADGA